MRVCVCQTVIISKLETNCNCLLSATSTSSHHTELQPKYLECERCRPVLVVSGIRGSRITLNQKSINQSSKIRAWACLFVCSVFTPFRQSAQPPSSPSHLVKINAASANGVQVIAELHPSRHDEKNMLVISVVFCCCATPVWLCVFGHKLFVVVYLHTLCTHMTSCLHGLLSVFLLAGVCGFLHCMPSSVPTRSMLFVCVCVSVCV